MSEGIKTALIAPRLHKTSLFVGEKNMDKDDLIGVMKPKKKKIGHIRYYFMYAFLLALVVLIFFLLCKYFGPTMYG